MLGESEGVVAVAVELAVGKTAEVTDTRKSQRHETVDELPGTVAAKSDVRTNGHSFTQFELRDGFAGLVDDGLLTRDGGEVTNRAVNHLRVASGLANTGVDNNLDQAWDLVGVGVRELLCQRTNDVGTVLSLQAGLDFASRGSCSIGH